MFEKIVTQNRVLNLKLVNSMAAEAIGSSTLDSSFQSQKKEW